MTRRRHSACNNAHVSCQRRAPAAHMFSGGLRRRSPAAGRLEEALLESLSALAIARRQLDAGGERACARFLAQLCQQAGHDDAASAWEHVVLRISP